MYRDFESAVALHQITHSSKLEMLGWEVKCLSSTAGSCHTAPGQKHRGAVAVLVVVRAVGVCRLNTAALDSGGSSDTDLERPETDHRPAAVRGTPAVPCTAAAEGNPAAAVDPADTPLAADHTVHFPLAPPVLHGCIAPCSIPLDQDIAEEVLDVVACKEAWASVPSHDCLDQSCPWGSVAPGNAAHCHQKGACCTVGKEPAGAS